MTKSKKEKAAAPRVRRAKPEPRPPNGDRRRRRRGDPVRADQPSDIIIRVRVTDAEDRRWNAVRRPGETFSDFVRTACASEAESREV